MADWQSKQLDDEHTFPPGRWGVTNKQKKKNFKVTL